MNQLCKKIVKQYRNLLRAISQCKNSILQITQTHKFLKYPPTNPLPSNFVLKKRPVNDCYLKLSINASENLKSECGNAKQLPVNEVDLKKKKNVVLVFVLLLHAAINYNRIAIYLHSLWLL